MSGRAMRAALKWTERGIPVFPTGRDKRPLTARGFHDATTDAEAVRAWWERWPDANVAVPTGERSRLVVLDIDGEQGADALAELERAHGRLPRTASTVTPRGGAHYWFRWPGDPVKTTAGVIAAGVDVRGDGGYVVAPPSVGTNGRRYEWDEQAPPADLPRWLLDRTSARDAERRREPAETWVRMVASGLAEGERNGGLTRLVGHLLARDVDVRLVAALGHLVNTRCRPPLDPEEVERIIESIAGREVAKRTGGGR